MSGSSTRSAESCWSWGSSSGSSAPWDGPSEDDGTTTDLAGTRKAEVIQHAERRGSGVVSLMICDNCESIWWSEAVEHFVRVQAVCQGCGSGPLVAATTEEPEAPAPSPTM